MMPEFEKYLDFWVEGQKRGFAGELPRIKLTNGSKMVALQNYPLLYVDNWYGSDLGGGQTSLYVLSEPWNLDDALKNPDNALKIVGTPIAILGYSGEIVSRLPYSEMNFIKKLDVFRNISSESDIVWKVLKAALSQVSRERPLRGPVYYRYPECQNLVYQSKERCYMKRTIGNEFIIFDSNFSKGLLFKGNYYFTLVKKRLEDTLI